MNSPEGGGNPRNELVIRIQLPENVSLDTPGVELNTQEGEVAESDEQNSIEKLRQQVGELATQVAFLGEKISSLSPQPEQTEQPDSPVESQAGDIEDKPAEPDGQITTSGLDSKSTPSDEVESFDIKPDESLTTGQQRAEKMILFLLEQEDFEFHAHNAGKKFSEVLGMTTREFGNTRLITMDSEVELIKDHEKATRSLGVRLNIQEVVMGYSKPYVTDRVMEKLKELNDRHSKHKASSNGSSHESSDSGGRSFLDAGRPLPEPAEPPNEIDELRDIEDENGQPDEDEIGRDIFDVLDLSEYDFEQDIGSNGFNQNGSKNGSEGHHEKGDQSLDEEQSRERKLHGEEYKPGDVSREDIDNFKKLSYRAAEVLAELEIAPQRQIRSKSKMHTKIKKLTGQKIEPGSYKSAIKKVLTKRGYIEQSHTETESIIALTEQGQKAIDILKQEPNKIYKEPAKQVGPTASKILDVMTDSLIYSTDEDGWIYMPENDYSILVSELASRLDTSTDVMFRRLYDLREERGYIESIKDDSGEIVRLRVSGIGKEALDMYREKRMDNELLDEDEVFEADQMIDTCIELADELGSTFISDQEKARRDERHLCELSEQEFLEERYRIEQLLKQLRREYRSHAEFSKVAA